MAVTQITTSVTILNSLLGYSGISLTNFTTNALSAISLGSKLEVAGAFFTWGTDETPGGWAEIATSTNCYLRCVPSGTAGSQIITSGWTDTAPVWSVSKQGWYASAASNIRVIGGCYKTSATQQDNKWLFDGDTGVQCILRYGDGSSGHNGTVRVGGYSSPAKGAGVEIDYGAAAAATGRMMAYDRTTGTYKPLYINSSVIAQTNGNLDIQQEGLVSRLTLKTYHTDPSSELLFYASRGTASSPTAIQSADTILQVAAFGYGATGFYATRGAFLQLVAAENFTDSAQGNYWTFSTTAKGTVTRSEKFRIGDDGKVTMASALTGVTTISASSVVQAAGGINTGDATLLHKVINIGEWNMLGDGSKTVAHGLTFSKIRICDAIILNDAGNSYYNLNAIGTGGELGGSVLYWDSTNIYLQRTVGGWFETTGFDATAGTVANRGFITVYYTP